VRQLCGALGEDWKKIRVLDPAGRARLRRRDRTIIRLGFDRRIGDAPVVPTLFSPLSLAKKLSGDRLQHDLRDHPAAVTGALERSPRRSSSSPCWHSPRACPASSTRSRRPADRPTPTRLRPLREPYDREFLEAIRSKSALTIIHCHGDRLMFDRLAQLPGHAWSWDDRATPPSLRDARAVVPVP